MVMDPNRGQEQDRALSRVEEQARAEVDFREAAERLVALGYDRSDIEDILLDLVPVDDRLPQGPEPWGGVVPAEYLK
jgi:hypothetical protein